jgi:hypothetical protein
VIGTSPLEIGKPETIFSSAEGTRLMFARQQSCWHAKGWKQTLPFAAGNVVDIFKPLHTRPLFLMILRT